MEVSAARGVVTSPENGSRICVWNMNSELSSGSNPGITEALTTTVSDCTPGGKSRFLGSGEVRCTRPSWLLLTDDGGGWRTVKIRFSLHTPPSSRRSTVSIFSMKAPRVRCATFTTRLTHFPRTRFPRGIWQCSGVTLTSLKDEDRISRRRALVLSVMLSSTEKGWCGWSSTWSTRYGWTRSMPFRVSYGNCIRPGACFTTITYPFTLFSYT